MFVSLFLGPHRQKCVNEAFLLTMLLVFVRSNFCFREGPLLTIIILFRYDTDVWICHTVHYSAAAGEKTRF